MRGGVWDWMEFDWLDTECWPVIGRFSFEW